MTAGGRDPGAVHAAAERVELALRESIERVNAARGRGAAEVTLPLSAASYLIAAVLVLTGREGAIVPEGDPRVGTPYPEGGARG